MITWRLIASMCRSLTYPHGRLLWVSQLDPWAAQGTRNRVKTHTVGQRNRTKYKGAPGDARTPVSCHTGRLTRVPATGGAHPAPIKSDGSGCGVKKIFGRGGRGRLAPAKNGSCKLGKSVFWLYDRKPRNTRLFSSFCPRR